MSTSLVEIFNLALSACGSEDLVSDPDERSREADLCRLWYPRARDFVITTAPWPSVRTYRRLARDAERDAAVAWEANDPAPSWRYRYAKPSDLLLPHHLQSFQPFEYQSNRISTNEETPILFYNRRVSDPTLWDEGLKDAIIHYLASRIARPLSGSRAVIEENFEISRTQAELARSNSANSEDRQYEQLPDWLQARGTSLLAPTKFYYPFTSFSMESSK